MGHMKIEMFKLIVDQAENNIEFISLASRGEPLVSPVIEKMLEYTRGKFLSLKIKTLVSYHPAFLLRSPQFKKEAWEDLQNLQQLMNQSK